MDRMLAWALPVQNHPVDPVHPVRPKRRGSDPNPGTASAITKNATRPNTANPSPQTSVLTLGFTARLQCPTFNSGTPGTDRWREPECDPGVPWSLRFGIQATHRIAGSAMVAPTSHQVRPRLRSRRPRIVAPAPGNPTTANPQCGTRSHHASQPPLPPACGP